MVLVTVVLIIEAPLVLELMLLIRRTRQDGRGESMLLWTG